MEKLPSLPYALTDLEPHISQKTLEFHYGKHHQGYWDKLQGLISGTVFEGLSLEEIIEKSYGSHPAIFNNAAQVWNHTFFWNSLSPVSKKTEPSEKLMQKIQQDFSSLNAFKTQFKEAALGQFGSGWAWLALHENTLEIIKTGNAETPLVQKNCIPLLTCDVWEHAYYLDYQNRRPDYVDVFLNHLMNWHFASENLEKALF